MSDVVVNVIESTTDVTVTEPTVAIDVTETSVQVSASTAGLQGATGATGVGYSGVTSTSVITIGSGLKTFTLVSGNQGAFVTGMRVKAIHSDTPTYYMEGTANYIGAGTLIITVDKFNGSGSHNLWNFSVAGEVGQTGATGSSGVVSVTSPITNTGTSSSAIVGIDLTNIAQRNTSNAFTTGGHTITSEAIGVFPLSIIPASGQTASTFRVRNSANNADLFSIDSSGQIRSPAYLNPNSFSNSRIRPLDAGSIIDTGIFNNVSLTVQNTNATATGNLTEWKNAGSTVVAKVGYTGDITAGFAYLSGLRDLAGSGAYINTTGTNILLNSRSATNKALVIQGASSQSANLLEIQNSAFGTVTSISATGTLNVNTSGTGILNLGDAQISKAPGSSFAFTSGLGQITSIGIRTAALNSEPLKVVLIDPTYKTVIQGAASQSANYFEIQDSSGATAVRIASSGQILAPSYTSGAFQVTSAGAMAVGTSGAVTTTQLLVNLTSATNLGVVVKGAVSQSGDITQWQNSGGTVLAKVSSGGVIFGNTYSGINGLVFLREESSGGLFEAKKLTASATNPGANNAKLYFRDGTTVGTLKLVVRAGAAGAETTILDNIPQ